MLRQRRETIRRTARARQTGGGGPPAFNPSLYGDIKVWLDATDVAGTGTNPANGTIVTTWKDKSGGGNDGTAGGNPVLSSTGVNGKAGFSLNGTMGFTGTTANTTTVSACFIVATLNAACSTYGRLISLARPTIDDNGGADRAIPLFRSNTSPQSLVCERAGVRPSTKAVPAYDTPFYAASIFDGTNNTIYINGSAGTTGASTGTFNLTSYAIGYQRVSNGDPWTGFVSEVLIYNSALSTTDRQAVESYLATKWGI